MYCKGAHAVILTYDITNRNSFDLVKSKFYENAKTLFSATVSMIIVGNKSDLQEDRKV